MFEEEDFFTSIATKVLLGAMAILLVAGSVTYFATRDDGFNRSNAFEELTTQYARVDVIWTDNMRSFEGPVHETTTISQILLAIQRAGNFSFDPSNATIRYNGSVLDSNALIQTRVYPHDHIEISFDSKE